MSNIITTRHWTLPRKCVYGTDTGVNIFLFILQYEANHTPREIDLLSHLIFKISDNGDSEHMIFTRVEYARDYVCELKEKNPEWCARRHFGIEEHATWLIRAMPTRIREFDSACEDAKKLFANKKSCQCWGWTHWTDALNSTAKNYAKQLGLTPS
jgi:hypothetical protein